MNRNYKLEKFSVHDMHKIDDVSTPFNHTFACCFCHFYLREFLKQPKLIKQFTADVAMHFFVPHNPQRFHLSVDLNAFCYR